GPRATGALRMDRSEPFRHGHPEREGAAGGTHAGVLPRSVRAPFRNADLRARRTGRPAKYLTRIVGSVLLNAAQPNTFRDPANGGFHGYEKGGDWVRSGAVPATKSWLDSGEADSRERRRPRVSGAVRLGRRQRLVGNKSQDRQDRAKGWDDSL